MGGQGGLLSNEKLIVTNELGPHIGFGYLHRDTIPFCSNAQCSLQCIQQNGNLHKGFSHETMETLLY